MMISSTAFHNSTDINGGAAALRPEQMFRVPEDAARLAGSLMLREGTTLAVRAMRADNTERLQAFHARLSPETIYLRFFTSLAEPPLELAVRWSRPVVGT